jgi:hypothetical protein
MDLSLSWEVTSCSATQECPNILWNHKIHYHIHKNPLLAPIQRQINPAHTAPSYLSTIHFNRLCGLVVRVFDSISGGPGSIPGTTRFSGGGGEVVGQERGPLSLVSTTEELLDRKVAAPV